MPRLLRRGFGALALASAVVVTVVVGPATPAAHGAEETPALSSDLAGIAVDSPAYRVAQRAYDTTAASLQQATNARVAAEVELAQLDERDAALTTQLRADTLRKKQAAEDLVASRAALRALAVHGYIYGTAPDTDPFTDPDESLRQSNVDAISRSVTQNQIDMQGHASDALAQAVNDLTADVTERTAVRVRAGEVENNRAAAEADEARFANQLLARRADLERARAVAVVVGEDFQLIALDAYWRAAQYMSMTRPDCGIAWWALAGIGRIESKHGNYGASGLGPDGTTPAPIIGIPLDGTNETEVIGDTDGGALDGDPLFDRAVGPMQFIPETWRRWAQDGNGDREENPSNVYDAALAAARYVCSGGAMRTDADMTRGFLAYNHSDAYAAAVLRYARQYESLAVPAPQPLPSITSGG